MSLLSILGMGVLGFVVGVVGFGSVAVLVFFIMDRITKSGAGRC